MGERWPHPTRRRLRSIQLQRVIELGRANCDDAMQQTDSKGLSKAAEGRSTMSDGFAPPLAAQRLHFKDVIEPASAPADMVRARPGLANPVDSARRVRDQLRQSGHAAAQMHAAFDGAPDRIDVD